MGMEPTTHIVGEPAISFTYDPKRSLYEQFSKAHGAQEGEGELETVVRRLDQENPGSASMRASSLLPEITQDATASEYSVPSQGRRPDASTTTGQDAGGPGTPFFNMFSLFEGSPNYKQRRKKGPKNGKSGLGSSGGGGRDSSEEDGLGSSSGVAGCGGSTDAIYDDGDMSATDLFDAQVRLGSTHSTQEAAKRQAENQRRVQEQHLALLNNRTRMQPNSQQQPLPQQPSSQQPLQGVYDQQFPSRSMHPSLLGSSASTSSAVASSSSSLTARPPVEQRQTYPFAAHPQLAYTSHAHSNTLPASNGLAMAPSVMVLPQTPNTISSALGIAPQRSVSIGSNTAVSNGAKTKVYMCPLYSCQRLFKRMEHMKRHYRTHTMEKPFECEVCQRRFSRADNLAQHVRTHNRDGVPVASSSAPTAVNANVGGVNVGPGDSTNSGAISDGDEDMDATIFGSAGSQYDDALFNSCEIELENPSVMHIEEDDVSGGVSGAADILGVNGYYNLAPTGTETPQFSHVVMSPENSPNIGAVNQLQNEWAATTSGALTTGQSVPYEYSTSHGQLSPAFSTASAPSPQGQSLTNPSSAMLMGGANGAYHLQNEYAGEGSHSAPAHKLTFDHTSLHQQALGLQGVPGVARPIRRYRSATPTIARGENIRRPNTANTVEPSPLSGAAARAYHPYVVPTTGATVPSVQSSPSSAFQAQLDYAQVAAVLERQQQDAAQGSHPHSRSSSAQIQVQDDVQQLLGMDPGYPGGPSAGPTAASYLYGQVGADASTHGHYVTSDPATYYSAETLAAASLGEMPRLDGSAAQYADHQYYDVNAN